MRKLILISLPIFTILFALTGCEDPASSDDNQDTLSEPEFWTFTVDWDMLGIADQETLDLTYGPYYNSFYVNDEGDVSALGFVYQPALPTYGPFKVPFFSAYTFINTFSPDGSSTLGAIQKNAAFYNSVRLPDGSWIQTVNDINWDSYDQYLNDPGIYLYRFAPNLAKTDLPKISFRDDFMEQANRLQSLDDGTLILSGYSSSWNSDQNSYPFYALLVQLDANGNILWYNEFRDDVNSSALATVQPNDSTFLSVISFDEERTYSWKLCRTNISTHQSTYSETIGTSAGAITASFIPKSSGSSWILKLKTSEGWALYRVFEDGTVGSNVVSIDGLRLLKAFQSSDGNYVIAVESSDNNLVIYTYSAELSLIKTESSWQEVGEIEINKRTLWTLPVNSTFDLLEGNDGGYIMLQDSVVTRLL